MEYAHLVISAHLIERNVYGEGGGVVVRSQKGLLIWLISHHEGQVKLSLQQEKSALIALGQPGLRFPRSAWLQRGFGSPSASTINPAIHAFPAGSYIAQGVEGLKP